jgi:hypothetical protein
MKSQENTIDKLIKFVNQRPGLDFNNYGDHRAYNAESREITKDRNDFFELLAVAQKRIGETFEEKLTFNLQKSSGRLVLNDKNELEYCTGQYFPTEYRPAANRILAQLLFNDFRDEMKRNEPNPVYKDGIEIRKAISKRVSRRLMKNYFN